MQEKYIKKILKRKKKFKARFLKKVFARFHMSLIMVCTVITGVLLSKLLLTMGVGNMIIRFPIVLIGAYFSFFLIMKLWLRYLTASYRNNKHDVLDVVDLINSDFSASRTSCSAIEGGGGQFGGGGATGSFEEAGVAAVSDPTMSGDIFDNIPSVDISDTAADAASGIVEEGGALLIPLAIIFIAILGGGIVLIYQAPLILSEAAFQIVLASSLIKSSKTMDSPDWIGSVFRTTWKPFIFTCVVSIIGVLIISHYCPEISKLSEVIGGCKN